MINSIFLDNVIHNFWKHSVMGRKPTLISANIPHKNPNLNTERNRRPIIPTKFIIIPERKSRITKWFNMAYQSEDFETVINHKLRTKEKTLERAGKVKEEIRGPGGELPFPEWGSEGCRGWRGWRRWRPPWLRGGSSAAYRPSPCPASAVNLQETSFSFLLLLFLLLPFFQTLVFERASLFLEIYMYWYKKIKNKNKR